jgi:hypothetical protein
MQSFRQSTVAQMTIFDELQNNAVQWLKEQDEYQWRSLQFLKDFTNEFREHIGAPPTPFRNLLTQQLQFYVRPVAAKYENDSYSFDVDPDDPLLVRDHEYCLLRDEEGYWITGIQLTIDTNCGPVSQLHYPYPIRYIIRDSTCEMAVSFEKREFRFPSQDAAKRKPVFDQMVELVRHKLTLKPWENSPTKDRIGFVR